MDTLQRIRESMKEDLAQLEALLSGSLQSNSPLLNSVTTHYLQRKGKQIRATLVLLAARLLGGVTTPTLQAAAAIELLHNSSLIHDDVVDASPLRRGNPTINAVWDNKIAVLSGDYFVSCALNIALQTQSIEVVQTLASLGKQLSQGEINQLNNLQTHATDEARYLEVVEQKTASLFVSCFQVAAYTAGATPQQLHALEEIGRLMGICFQLKDDLFDFSLNHDALGKPVALDLSEGKISLPLIYAANNEAWEGCAQLRILLQQDEHSEEEIGRLRASAHEGGGIAYAEQCMTRFVEEALTHLTHFAESPERNQLAELIAYTAHRDR